MAGSSSATTRFALLPGHDEGSSTTLFEPSLRGALRDEAIQLYCGKKAGLLRCARNDGRRGTAPFASRLFNRRARQHGVAGFHPVDVVERIPGRADIRCRRMRLVMTYEIADQRLG